MVCKHCGADLPEGTQFCPVCGRPVETETAIGENKPFKLTENFALLTACVLSAIAFVMGVIFFSMILARGGVITGYTTFIELPAFGGLVFGIYAFCRAKSDKEKLFSKIALLLAGFSIFYGFITYCVLFN